MNADAYGDPIPPGHGEPEPRGGSSNVISEEAWMEMAEIERFLADHPVFDMRVLDSLVALAEDLPFA